MRKICFILAMILLFAGCGAPAEVAVEEETSELEVAVRDALLEYHRGIHDELDCDGVGFVIMGEDAVDGKLSVYTICSYGAYEEKDGAMCKMQGHACLPMVVVLDEKSLDYIEVKEPDDSIYYESVESLFPEEYYERVFNLSIEDFTDVSGMEADMISKYLEKNDLEMAIKY